MHGDLITARRRPGRRDTNVAIVDCIRIAIFGLAMLTLGAVLTLDLFVSQLAGGPDAEPALGLTCYAASLA